MRRNISRLFIILATLVAGLALSAPAASGRPTKLVSLGTLGNAGNMQSGGPERAPAISADGRYMAFQSLATDLVEQDTNGMSDIFARDLWAGVTTRVSVSSLGAQAMGESSSAAISGDGRYIAFQSSASNLVAGDTNSDSDVFVRDTLLGTTELVSVSSSGAPGDASSVWPSISGDGHSIAFSSNASNLADPGSPAGKPNVFVRDLVAGTTVRASVSVGGGWPALGSYAPAISPDGRYVAFHSGAADLVLGDANNVSDVFVRDLVGETTIRISVPGSGGEANGGSQYASISEGGSVVAFESEATNLVVGDTNTAFDVFVRAGALSSGATTQRISVSASGAQGTGPSVFAAMSADGASVAFTSLAPDLVPGDTNSKWDVFVRQRQSAATLRVSISSAGAQADNDSFVPMISGDGQLVGFTSTATNLVSESTFGVGQVYAHIFEYACPDGTPETGPVSGPIHEQVEPAAGPAEGLVNRANCEVVVPHDL